MDRNTNSQPTIEHATQSDIEAVTDLWVRLARNQRLHESSVLPERNRESMRETLAAHQVAECLLVARVGGSVVGFASFTLERGTLALDTTRGLLSNIYVDPPFRGQGIGTALLEAAEDELASQGASVVTLEVMAMNDDARRFYARHGYDSYRVSMKRSLEDDDRSKNDTHSKGDR